MLAIDRMRAELHALPLLARIGLAVVMFGALGDLVAHASFAGPVDGGHTAAQLSAHAVAFGGMVLVLAGVVVDGVRHTRSRRNTTARSAREACNAVR